MPIARRLLLTVALLPLAVVFGCGDPEVKPLDMGGSEGDQISALIEEVNEGAGDAKKQAALFAKGSKPADPKKMPKCNFTIVGKPAVSGTTGTAKVRVDPAAGGASLGEVEWSFEKDGDKWKIKSAPLP